MLRVTDVVSDTVGVACVLCAILAVDCMFEHDVFNLSASVRLEYHAADTEKERERERTRERENERTREREKKRTRERDKERKREREKQRSTDRDK